MTYGWLITKDHLCEGPNDRNDEGTMGPNTCPFTMGEVQRKGQPFKMYDDDGELYYEGRCIHDGDEESVFSPLNNFGMPNAGCTSIKYRDPKTGKWETM